MNKENINVVNNLLSKEDDIVLFEDQKIQLDINALDKLFPKKLCYEGF